MFMLETSYNWQVPIHEWRKQVASVRQTSKEFWLNKKMKFASNMPPRRA